LKVDAVTEGDADSTSGVSVAAAIESLRNELEMARLTGAGRVVQFEVTGLTLTLTVVAGGSKEAGGKLRWWVVEGGGTVNSSREMTQTLVVNLLPTEPDGAGGRKPLDVGGEDVDGEAE
jgi:hypothetical protein